MSILSRINAFFAFSTKPVTVLTLLVYAALFISTIWIHEVPASPPSKLRKQLGLDLDVAWRDLQALTTYPHPYNSHENDAVRRYILQRVTATAEQYDYVHISDDNSSNATYAGTGLAGSQLVYFEGNNVLVKIDGSRTPDDSTPPGAVLFSAHFDSVSTAPGATDDGMGVSTLLQLVDYFGKNRPTRDVIFNINNGEEDWLNGAHAFLEHPWAALPTVFLNLEGAGSAGRPQLFRTSSAGVTKAFRSARHPHGNAVSNDGFKAGLVRSGTDFSVYTKEGLEGLDLAFYRKRSRYHTKYDSVSGLGGRSSLWLMMEAALGSGQALVKLVDRKGRDSGAEVVYFDLFGVLMVVLEQNTMFIINIVMLAVGPVAVLALVLLLNRQDKLYWSSERWVRFPLALVLGSAAPVGLAYLYTKFSPAIIYSSPYSVLVSLFCATYLVMFAILRTLSWYHPTDATPQRSVVLFEMYMLWWILLLLDSIFLKAWSLGGGYFITFFHAGTLSALLVVFIEMLCAKKVKVTNFPPTPARRSEENGSRNHSAAPAAPNRRASYQSIPPTPETTQNGIRNGVPTVEREEDVRGDEHEATERTPLIPHEADHRAIGVKDSHWTTPLWGLEFILASVFPVILVLQLVLVLLTALSETLADGSNPSGAYLMTAVFVVLIVLPLAPFLHKIQRTVSFVVLLILLLTVAYNMLSFPFGAASPLKVYFQQTMDLDADPLGGNSTVRLVGVTGYVKEWVIPAIPSGWDAMRNGDGVICDKASEKKGLTSCSFPGLTPKVAPEVTRGNVLTTHNGKPVPEPPTTIPPRNKTRELIELTTERISASTGRFVIKAANTRNCRIYFDDPVTSVRVQGGNTKLQKGYEIPAEGISEVRMWSRTWDRTFDVYVDWEGKVKSEKVKGKVACEWAEMREERIPALDEVVSFLPTWAVVTKLADGLVEGVKKFEI